MTKLEPVCQIPPEPNPKTGKYEIIYNRVMTEQEIRKTENYATPHKFNRIEDGKTIFHWDSPTPPWSGQPEGWREETEEEKKRKLAQEADRRRADAVRRRLNRKK